MRYSKRRQRREAGKPRDASPARGIMQDMMVPQEEAKAGRQECAVRLG